MSLLPPALSSLPVAGLGRPFTGPEAEQFDKYMNLLIKWQKTHRLIGSVDPAWMVDNVILDSLAFLQALPASVSWIADVGSGAGLPGIPIAIVRPDISMSLIEARQRRVSFLSTVVRELGLSRVEVVASRAEVLGEGYISRYDAVVMRCAGGIGTMLKAALGLLRTGGVVVVSSAPTSPRPPTAERLTVTSSTGRSRTLDRFVKL